MDSNKSSNINEKFLNMLFNSPIYKDPTKLKIFFGATKRFIRKLELSDGCSHATISLYKTKDEAIKLKKTLTSMENNAKKKKHDLKNLEVSMIDVSHTLDVLVETKTLEQEETGDDMQEVEGLFELKRDIVEKSKLKDVEFDLDNYVEEVVKERLINISYHKVNIELDQSIKSNEKRINQLLAHLHIRKEELSHVNKSIDEKMRKLDDIVYLRTQELSDENLNRKITIERMTAEMIKLRETLRKRDEIDLKNRFSFLKMVEKLSMIYDNTLRRFGPSEAQEYKPEIWIM